MSYKSVAKLLGMAYEYGQQDWPVESADPERIEEFIGAYESAEIADYDRRIVMELIIASCDDFIQKYDGVPVSWGRVEQLLEQRLALFVEDIRKWSCGDVDISLALHVSPLMRSFMEKHRISWEDVADSE